MTVENKWKCRSCFALNFLKLPVSVASCIFNLLCFHQHELQLLSSPKNHALGVANKYLVKDRLTTSATLWGKLLIKLSTQGFWLSDAKSQPILQRQFWEHLIINILYLTLKVNSNIGRTLRLHSEKKKKKHFSGVIAG